MAKETLALVRSFPRNRMDGLAYKESCILP